MTLTRIRATLTSDASGDATFTTIEKYKGVVRAIGITNNADAQPSASWDVSVTNPNMSEGVTAVPNKILVDIAVDQLVTQLQWYVPTLFGVVPTTGVPNTLSDNVPMLCDGPLSVIGANMGDTKIAYVDIWIER